MASDISPLQLLVNFSRENIQSRLVTSLYKPDLFADLLAEDDALVAERTRVKALLDAYKEAFKCVGFAGNRLLSVALRQTLMATRPSHSLPCRVLSEVTVKST